MSDVVILLATLGTSTISKNTTNFHWRFCTGHNIDVALIYTSIRKNL